MGMSCSTINNNVEADAAAFVANGRDDKGGVAPYSIHTLITVMSQAPSTGAGADGGGGGGVSSVQSQSTKKGNVSLYPSKATVGKLLEEVGWKGGRLEGWE